MPMPTIAAENETTIQNLLAAFEGESNAHAKYIAFAVKADQDGILGAASLFRAAGRAEQIHAANHARVIKQLGGEAKCEIHPVEIKTTLENPTSRRSADISWRNGIRNCTTTPRRTMSSSARRFWNISGATATWICFTRPWKPAGSRGSGWKVLSVPSV